METGLQDHFKVLALSDYLEGYRETVMLQIHGEQKLEDAGIDIQRFSPNSASWGQYQKGKTQALKDMNINSNIEENIIV